MNNADSNQDSPTKTQCYWGDNVASFAVNPIFSPSHHPAEKKGNGKSLIMVQKGCEKQWIYIIGGWLKVTKSNLFLEDFSSPSLKT